jgi:hypothetical protein
MFNYVVNSVRKSVNPPKPKPRDRDPPRNYNKPVAPAPKKEYSKAEG